MSEDDSKQKEIEELRLKVRVLQEIVMMDRDLHEDSWTLEDYIDYVAREGIREAIKELDARENMYVMLLDRIVKLERNQKQT